MNNIQMIPVERLRHHPENPRQDLGDLTELTESIRKNGVMQNLTVVPDKMDGIDTGRYLVVIGNRRLEAAKAAGIVTVVVDRGGFKYTGRVAAIVEAAVEAGLAVSAKKEDK